MPEQGEIILATVTKVMDHGAYVTLDEYEDIQGFLHISEIAPGWIRSVNRFVKDGEKKVLLVKKVKAGDIDLSFKQVSKDQKKQKLKEVKKFEKGKTLLQNVQDKAKLSDEEIEKTTGATIDWIFDLEGESGFRKRESEVLSEMVDKNSVVLSTGGGIILSDQNRELLSSRGTVFYLATPINVQLERTSKDKDRPLLKEGDPSEILQKLHDQRVSLYEEVADYVVNTENLSSQEVASEIIKLVKNYG